jgi:ribosomal protein S3
MSQAAGSNAEKIKMRKAMQAALQSALNNGVFGARAKLTAHLKTRDLKFVSESAGKMQLEHAKWGVFDVDVPEGLRKGG